MKKNMNTYKGWELIDEDRYTFARENDDGSYTFVGLKEINDNDDFLIQTATYDASDELEQDQWGVFMIVWEEGYGMNPNDDDEDEYMDKEIWLENLEQNYGNNIELVIDKCLFWQDFANEDICTIHGWDRACLKIKGFLEIM